MGVCSHASSSAKVICSEVDDDTRAQRHNSKSSVFPSSAVGQTEVLSEQIPSTLHKEVSDKLACLAEGKRADAMGQANS